MITTRPISYPYTLNGAQWKHFNLMCVCVLHWPNYSRAHYVSIFQFVVECELINWQTTTTVVSYARIGQNVTSFLFVFSFGFSFVHAIEIFLFQRRQCVTGMVFSWTFKFHIWYENVFHNQFKWRISIDSAQLPSTMMNLKIDVIDT